MASQYEPHEFDDEEGEQALREQEVNHAPSSSGLALPILQANTSTPTHLPQWLTTEAQDVQRDVFLVTFAHVLEATALSSSTPLRTLDGLTREDVRDAMLDAISNPIVDASRGGRPRTIPIAPVCMVVVLEEPLHFHVALKMSTKSRFLPFKAALRQRSGLASHWSTSHSMLWSATRYCTHRTDHKEVDEHPLPWLPNDEHLGNGFVVESWLFEKSQEPFNAPAIKRRREVAVMKAGGSKHAKTEKFSKLDFVALVQDQGLRTPNQAIAYMSSS